jgi:hypothetical protein
LVVVVVGSFSLCVVGVLKTMEGVETRESVETMESVETIEGTDGY